MGVPGGLESGGVAELQGGQIRVRDERGGVRVEGRVVRVGLSGGAGGVEREVVRAVGLDFGEARGAVGPRATGTEAGARIATSPRRRGAPVEA